MRVKYLTREGHCQCLRAWQWSQASRDWRDLWGRCLDDRKHEPAAESGWLTLTAALDRCLPCTIRSSKAEAAAAERGPQQVLQAWGGRGSEGPQRPCVRSAQSWPGIMLQDSSAAETLLKEMHSFAWNFSTFNLISSASVCVPTLKL